MKEMLPNLNFYKKIKFFHSIALVAILTLGASQAIFAQGNVGIGTTSPDASAVLDIVSTTKGVLVPRLKTADRDAIVSPKNGLLVYNTDDLKFNYFNGTIWVAVGDALAWFTGQGQPADMGKVNDLYLDEQSGDIYQRVYDSLNPLVLVWNRFNFSKKNKQKFPGTSKTILSGNSDFLTFNFDGVGINSAVVCSPMFDLAPGLVISQAWVSSTGVITVKFFNGSNASATLDAGDYQIVIF